MRLVCKYALFYCPFAFIIDAKIQYVVANFVQNVMWCLQRKKKQRHSEIEGFKYCAVDVFNVFCPFPIQSDRQ